MKKTLLAALAACLSVCLCFGIFAACGGDELKDGTYTENGLIFTVENRNVTITGVEEGVSEVTVPAQFKGVDVDGIAENALAESSVKKLTFSEGLSQFFSIGAFAFNLSSIEEIIHFPANISMINMDALAGLKNLKSITVTGEGEFSIENGALIQTEEDQKVLRLLPAASEPQSNYNAETKTYTVTGYSEVFNHAVSYNQYIENVTIGKDTVRVQEDAFSHIKLTSVTMERDDDEYNGVSNVMIEGGAFTAYKGLKIYVPAESNSEMSTWLSNSKNYIYGHNLLIHPVGCDRTDAHIHGIRNQLGANAVLAGYDITLHEDSQTIDIDGTYSIMSYSAKDLFTEYEG